MKHRYKLKNIYQLLGTSKQAHNQYMQRRAKDNKIAQYIVKSVEEVRRFHPRMGLVKIYNKLLPNYLGRDKFLEIGIDNGLGISPKRSYHRTTFSTKSAWFSNLAGVEPINGINQVWVSDTTYFRLGSIFYYLTFIQDVYSRKIVGHYAHTNLEATANCKTLERAIANRKGYNLKGLIHHSDKGSQYASDDYLKILIDNEIAISMCESVYENTHAERLNGIIKNEYLYYMKINSFRNLQNKLDKVVKLYNEDRPHLSLKNLTPVQFEESLSCIQIEKREVLQLYLVPNKPNNISIFN